MFIDVIKRGQRGGVHVLNNGGEGEELNIKS